MDPSGTRQMPQPGSLGLGQGPLQAFGNMQRALRDADKRIDALGQSQLQVATAVDGKVNKAVRRVHEDNKRLRKETHDLLAELEQLTLQMYEEHEAALASSREAQAAQRSSFEALRDTHQATLEAQQAQIDALGAVVRKQQGMIDELTSASAMQMAAVQAELAELGRGFSAQVPRPTAPCLCFRRHRARGLRAATTPAARARRAHVCGARGPRRRRRSTPRARTRPRWRRICRRRSRSG